ncbi:hypothetical protein GWK47_032876 [Chionoecetes opilio]|uniref:Uncharacterized protein n=1 Tax=Chionoecetes opilio TaxID=41210 RepID=A0A8J5D3L6_CHIOP|nr:hypothetical protein GWK47_032876 [Chionoecetes opilio]
MLTSRVVVEAFEVSQRSTSVCPGRTVSWVFSRLGLAKSSISSSSRTPDPLPLLSMSPASIVLDGEGRSGGAPQSPHHDRDSRFRGLGLRGLVALRLVMRLPGPSPPSTGESCTSWVSAWMSSVNSFMARWRAT